MLKVVHDTDATNENSAAGGSLLDEIVRDGARAMLAAALQAEVAAYIDAHLGEVDENGYRLVVRNGYHGAREVLTAAGAVPVRAPRVNDQRVDPETGERQRFSSAILPAWARKSAQVAEVLPLLYLHGLSSSDFGPALEQFLGSSAGLSAATITRLTAQWQDDAEAFTKRSLADTDYVYVWVDGIHLKIRLEQDKVCLLVMIGVGGSAAVVSPPRDDRSGAGGRRRGAGVLEGLAGGVPRHPRAAVLVPRQLQCSCRPAEVSAPRCQSRARRDLQRRGPRPRPAGDQSIRCRLRRQVAQGSREDHRAHRCAAGVLRLPRGALDTSENDQPDRVHLRHRPA